MFTIPAMTDRPARTGNSTAALRLFSLLAVMLIAGCRTVPSTFSPRTVVFAGHEWIVKDFDGAVGPGPNFFSADPRNVWVDWRGRLHLRIERRGNRWYCAEVSCTEPLGQGTYRFQLDSDVAALDPNVVLGLFTWSNTPDYHNREIDIEFSRWGNPTGPNAQFVVQPYDVPSNRWTWFLPAGLKHSTHSIKWSPGVVDFRSTAGHRANPHAGEVIAQQEISGPGVPPAGDESPRLNLWLRQGLSPTDGRSVEVIIAGFQFEPL